MWSKEVPKEEGMYYAYDTHGYGWQIAHVRRIADGKTMCIIGGHFSFDCKDAWYWHVPLTETDLPPDS